MDLILANGNHKILFPRRNDTDHLVVPDPDCLDDLKIPVIAVGFLIAAHPPGCQIGNRKYKDKNQQCTD
jgi:hypothetical protein